MSYKPPSSPLDSGLVSIFMTLSVAFIAIFLFVWMAFVTDCKNLGWMPIKDLPARCIDK